ncbi:MAG: hypothetical protein SFV24_19105 [Gemmatimonadales bacterium]|nr:hypothetical protein [Gemmatimonadales bacterium]
MSTPTRFPFGIGTAEVDSPLKAFVAPSPFKWHTFFDDFDYFVAASWTVTETQAGATQALVDGDGGLLALVNTAVDNDLNSIQKVGESFRFTAGKKLIFACRFKVSDATQSDVVVGLQITDTTPLDVTDGVFFIKADDAATVALLVEKNNVNTSTAAGSLANDTFTELAFYYNGVDAVEVFKDSVLVGRSVVTNLPDDEDLTITLAVQNGDANARTLTVDYVFVAKER